MENVQSRFKYFIRSNDIALSIFKHCKARSMKKSFNKKQGGLSKSSGSTKGFAGAILLTENDNAVNKRGEINLL